MDSFAFQDEQIKHINLAYALARLPDQAPVAPCQGFLELGALSLYVWDGFGREA